jgi:predicted nucleotidyltransferase
MFEGDPRTCKELPPGIYVLNFTSKGKALRKEILVDCDLSVPLD